MTPVCRKHAWAPSASAEREEPMRGVGCRVGLVSACGLGWCLALGGATACDEETGGLAGGLLISPQQEAEIGKGVDLEIKAEYKIADPADPVTLWATQLVGKLADSAKRFRDPAPFGGYKVAIIVDDELVNAFAAPGGYTYIATGLVLKAKTCAEIAGVLSHELGHVVKKHGVKRLEQSVLATQVLSSLLGSDKSLGKDVAAGVWKFLQATQFSQSDEGQSDSVGVQVTFETGYNPYGLRDFFQVLLDQQKGQLSLPPFLSSHPATADRIAAIEKEIAARYGAKVQPTTTQTYDCLGTTLTLAELQKRITAKQILVQVGTGTAAGADAGASADAGPAVDATLPAPDAASGQ
ncbi:MAG: hypothetical protein EXR79_09250 [Myxococcales bacterium]|nr:hypothetical protein [Myxococcales bacterium]